RSIRVVMTAARKQGTYDDAYFDNLQLTLTKAVNVIQLPSASKCVRRNTLTLRLRQPRGDAIQSAKVSVNGKQVKLVRGSALTKRITLANLPKHRFKVKVTVTLASGQVLKKTHSYGPCKEKKKKGHGG